MRKIILSLLILFASSCSLAQKKQNEDSLLKIVKESRVDSILLKTHFELARMYRNSNPSAAVQHSKLALAYVEKTGDEHLLGKIYNNLGTSYSNMGSRAKALTCYQKSFDTHMARGERTWAYIAWYNIGLLKSDEGNLTEAMQYYVDAMKVFEEEKDTQNLLLPIMGIGAVYAKLGKYEDSRDNFLKAKAILEKDMDIRKMSTCLNNLASSYAYLKEFDKSVEMFKEALELHRKAGDVRGTAMIMYNISSPLLEMGKKEEALAYVDSSIEINRTRNDPEDLAISYQNKAAILMELKRIEEAEGYLLKALELARDNKQSGLLESIYHSLHKYYREKDDFRKALEYHVLYAKLHDSLVNDQLVEVNKIEKEYEREVRDKEIAILNKEKEFEEYRLGITRFIGAGLVIVLIIVISVLFQRYRIKKRSNEQLEHMNQLISEKNKDITDSISYASRIQEAILPAKEIKKRLFKDAFVLFMPRDVVSGDFYWFGEKDGKKLIAAIDCTGHGVPGAFMSMIGNAFLNEIVFERGITRPDLILNNLRYRVVTSLKQSGDAGAKDGMDASICVFDEDFTSVEFAGANNPMWIIRKGEKEVFIVPADKQPIGLSAGIEKPFTLKRENLEEGDMVYIFTDGFPDQFGGPKQKKFNYRRFREELISMAHLPGEKQEENLTMGLLSWKGGMEQTDDILVIGVKIRSGD